MADITKCSGKKDTEICPLRNLCYRYTAKVSAWQSWFVEAPFKENKCREFWGVV